jgi:hypothetical protein
MTESEPNLGGGRGPLQALALLLCKQWKLNEFSCNCGGA